jgi:general secretion pathway protein J
MMASRAIPPRRTQSTAGFTLIEILVSLALMGMAAALLLQGLQMAGIVAGRERIRGNALEDIVAAQRIVRGTIERLRPIMRIDTLATIIDLRGNSGVLTFIAPPLARSAPDALQRFRLMRSATGELALYTASTRKPDIDRSARGLAGWTRISLLQGTASVSISYFGSAINDRRRFWQDRWWDRARPPELVRIRVEFPPGDRRSWPDLIVRPRALGIGCAADAFTGACGAER